MKVFIIGELNHTDSVPTSLKIFTSELFLSKPKVSKDALILQVTNSKDAMHALINKVDALKYADLLPRSLEIAWDDYYPVYEVELKNAIDNATKENIEGFEIFKVAATDIRCINSIEFSNKVSQPIIISNEVDDRPRKVFGKEI